MKLTELVVEEVEDKLERGTYVCVKFSDHTVEQLVKLTAQLDMNTTNCLGFHSTVMYSLKALPDLVEDTPDPLNFDPPHMAKPKGFEIFREDDGNVLVLLIESKYLVDRHNEILDDYGAEYTFPTYLPHITLSYDCGEFDINSIDVSDYITEIEIVREQISPLMGQLTIA